MAQDLAKLFPIPILEKAYLGNNQGFAVIWRGIHIGFIGPYVATDAFGNVTERGWVHLVPNTPLAEDFKSREPDEATFKLMARADSKFLPC